MVGGGLDDFGHITWQPDGKLTVSLRAAAALSRRRNSNSDFDRSTGHGGFSETSADTEAAGAFAATTRTAAEMGTANATTTEAAASGEVRWPARGRVDLLLAMPSPRVLARILPLVAAFGVDRLFLTGEPSTCACACLNAGTCIMLRLPDGARLIITSREALIFL